MWVSSLLTTLTWTIDDFLVSFLIVLIHFYSVFLHPLRVSSDEEVAFAFARKHIVWNDDSGFSRKTFYTRSRMYIITNTCILFMSVSIVQYLRKR